MAFVVAIMWVVPWPCPVRFVLGIPCPSCGLTRAARAAVTLHFADATRIHPLWFVVLPALGAWIVAELGAFVVRGRALGLERRRWFQITAGLILGALIWVWIARFLGAFGGPVAI